MQANLFDLCWAVMQCKVASVEIVWQTLEPWTLDRDLHRVSIDSKNYRPALASSLRRSAMPSGERSVTLVDLLEAGIIEPRKSALSVSYKSIETIADLLPDGTISLKQVPLLQGCLVKPDAN